MIVGGLFKREWNDAKNIGNFTILSSGLYASVCAGLLFTFINPIARIFVTDDLVHEKDFQTVKNFLRIQAIMEIVNSVGNSGASVLAGCLETRIPFFLTIAFILTLNSLIMTAAFFAFNHNAPALYAVQLIGLVSTSVGVMLHWKQEDNKNHTVVAMNDVPVSIVVHPSISLWQTPQTESPRNSAINDLIPACS